MQITNIKILILQMCSDHYDWTNTFVKHKIKHKPRWHFRFNKI